MKRDVTPAVTKALWVMSRMLWTHPSFTIVTNDYTSGHHDGSRTKDFIQPEKVPDSSSGLENSAVLVGIMPAGVQQLRG